MSMMRRRPWSDLPPELITDIAERLGLLEVVRFRSVCQAWSSASSTISAKIESLLDYEPWFLQYGNDSGQCQLVTTENGSITMNLPQLDETTTCIASYEGWLLVFKQGGSMFFFRPFSKTKIDLPNFPVSELTDHVAAFSSPPTSADCTVCVINRSASNDDHLELHLLCRKGGNEWIQEKLACPRSLLDKIKCGARGKLGEFSFFDHSDNMVKLSVTNNGEISWQNFKVINSKYNTPESFYCHMKYFKKADMMNKLGLADPHEDATFSVCGTQMKLDGRDKFIFNEVINNIVSDHVEESKRHREFKGVWIYPRFYQVSPKEQSW